MKQSKPRSTRSGAGSPSALDEYAAKRRFEQTPEPAPKTGAGLEGPLLFVVQQHDATRLHYDLRLECDGVLLSWAVPRGPSRNPADKRMAIQTEDHPYDYGSFEGAIPPKQYGAGEVIVWDCGVYSPDEQGRWFHDRAEAQRQVREGLAKGKLSFELRGCKLKGSFALVRTKEAKSWLLIKHKDRFVSQDDLSGQDRSVLSGHRVAELKYLRVTRLDAGELAVCGKPESLPAKLAPMLAETADAPFDKPDWLWEPKLDGYRILAFVSEEGVVLRSRRGLDLSRSFPRLCTELQRETPPGTIIDGEIVAFDASGKPSFNTLQNRVQLKTEREIAAADQQQALVLFAFDLPWFAGVDLRRRPCRHRQRYLRQSLLPSATIQLVHQERDGVALQAAALASGFEGVIGKHLDSRYEDGRRSTQWIKVKPTQTADFVIGGYTAGKGSRGALGAILLGYWERGKLRFAAHCGSGFDSRTLKSVHARLSSLARKSCPFVEEPEVNGKVTWVQPQCVAEVSFQQWTEDASLRAPIFVRLRDDVEARSVRRSGHESSAPATSAEVPGDIDAVLAQLDSRRAELTLAVAGHRIKLTHLDRVCWPENAALEQPPLTKRDLLRYLAQVSPFMLPHLQNRPLTLIRMPDGITRQRFFQKHWEQDKPAFVDTLQVWSSTKDESHEALICNNLATLLWLGQSGTIEFHVWHSRAATGADTRNRQQDYASSEAALEASLLNFPDYVVFDIDPYIYSGQEAPGAEPELNTRAFEKGKEVAFWLRELLHSMQLEPIVKLSGKTGLHVFVPIQRTLDFDAAREVSELVSGHLQRLHRKDITLEWSVPKRAGKIFMDFNMNVRGKTLNVAYSPRGEAGAPVSMPVTWEELAGAHPHDFRLTNAIARLAKTGDRWADVLDRKQNVLGALGRQR